MTLPPSSAPVFNLGPLPEEPLSVRKVAAIVPMSDEMAAEAAATKAAFDWALNATPEEMAARQAELAQARAGERAATERVPLTCCRLIDHLGWTTEYAEHFVQSYCTCSDSYDGWDFCAHARDEGFVDTHTPAASSPGDTEGGET